MQKLITDDKYPIPEKTLDELVTENSPYLKCVLASGETISIEEAKKRELITKKQK